MSRNVIITGDVSYRAGDGARLPIPRGLCQMDQSADDVTLGWQDGENLLSAAMPQSEFQRYFEVDALHFQSTSSDDKPAAQAAGGPSTMSLTRPGPT